MIILGIIVGGAIIFAAGCLVAWLAASSAARAFARIKKRKGGKSND